ncbi:MAG: hypothetical protein M3282_02290, partial [Gemmatimonadota bacterium]|nr:hypothetical protein [Gemmatimonadota bacterium]
MPLTTSKRLPTLATSVAAAVVACGSPAGPAGGRPIDGATAMRAVAHGAYVDRFTAELSVHGTTAYTSTWGTRGTARGNAIMIWDVSGATPQLVDSVIVEPNVTTTGDVAVSDDGTLLVVATERAPGNIVVYDLADPRKPRELSRFTTTGGGGVHTAEIGRVGGKLYAVLAANGGASAPSRV